jgi:murein DD-endopeptidase MepM/ murein hydrolase activator NlpD
MRTHATLGFVAAVLIACSGEDAAVPGAGDELASTSAALTGSVPLGSTLQTTAPLNLRTGASTSYAILLTVPQGAFVTTVNTTSPTNGFYNVKYGGTVGWASGAYLKLVSSPSTSTRFRVPLSLADTQCGGGRCYPTRYFDTNRTTSYQRDWSCRTGSSAKTYDQHTGTDLAIGGFANMDDGRYVLAAAAGTGIATHDGEYDRCTTGNCGTANYVMVKHADGKVSKYWHLRKWSVRVKVGQTVGCGQIVGLVGSSGYSTGPHLHFGYLATASSAPTDPFLQTSSCGGSTASRWTLQGSWGGLPGGACQ